MRMHPCWNGGRHFWSRVYKGYCLTCGKWRSELKLILVIQPHKRTIPIAASIAAAVTTLILAGVAFAATVAPPQPLPLPPSSPSSLAPTMSATVELTIEPMTTSKPTLVLAKPIVTLRPTLRPTARPIAGLPTIDQTKAYILATLGAKQALCLENIIAYEDPSWDPHATNPRSGAYGLPQAWPGSKLASAGAGWRDNRVVQIAWMVDYVDHRYGSACNAWAYKNAHGSY
jgi:hypothetical protein